jgi:hypothetical protein
MIVMIVFVAATVSALLIRARPKALPLVLAFERYSTGLDFYAPHVAFLSLTNTSGKTYYLAMTGNIDTRQLDTPIGLGRYKAGLSESLLVDCYFSDQTPTGTSNWAQRVSFTNARNCLALTAHSAARLRVPLPLEGKRKVAVLCAESAASPSGFWLGKFGVGVLSRLPRGVRNRVLQPKLTMLRVWCDRELSPSAERSPTK